MGAVRLAGQNAVIQQANAIESLSHVDVLCLDKTGTLTTNRIELHQIYPVEGTEAEIRAALGDFAASVSASNRTTDALRQACPGVVRPIQAEVPFSSAYKWISYDDGKQPRLLANLNLLAVLIFSDELRPKVRQTLTDFAEAEVSIKVISAIIPIQ